MHLSDFHAISRLTNSTYPPKSFILLLRSDVLVQMCTTSESAGILACGTSPAIMHQSMACLLPGIVSQAQNTAFSPPHSDN